MNINPRDETTQELHGATENRIGQLTNELNRLRAAFKEYKDLFDNDESGDWAWDEMSGDLQEAWCKLVREMMA